jgi:acyl-CoA synthetase (AMP-forming)/AMP-acid ligase II
VVTAQSLTITCPPTDLVTIAPSEADERIALICFSSGTSGPAKGVMTSHRNLVSNIEQWYGQVVPDFDFSPHIICFIPMSHIYGLHIFVFAGLWSGRRVVIMSKFQLDVYLRSIQKYRSVDLFTVPPVVLLLVKSPLVEKYDLSSVQRIMSAAAPLTPELSSALEYKFKQLYGTIVYCYQGYGMTEASPLVCMVPFPELGMTFSIGRPIPNIPLRFVNPDTMEDVKTNPDGSTEHGEIWVTGPNVMKGYYNNAAANQAAFQLDADGTRWYRTGDVGCMDRDGYVTINDRIKEMIKYKGFQVIPSELEGKLVEHPHIEDAAVVGYYAQDQATELPVAFVVLAREATNDAAKAVEGIHQWLNKRVANHKRLRGGIWILNSIPKNSSGKILRRRLRDLLQDERSGKL